MAYEVSKLNKEYQKQACELYEEAGVLTLDDIRDLYRQQEAEKGIPGQMTIETATGQNRPPEDDTEIPAETQIERFYESTNKNMKEKQSGGPAGCRHTSITTIAYSTI